MATKRSVKAHLVTEGATEAERRQLDENERTLVDEWYPADDRSMLEVFRRSTYVLCCLPLTPATRACITTRHFEALGAESYFINVSRGDVVDQDALIAALEGGTIAGAVLDVVRPLRSSVRGARPASCSRID